MWTWIVTMKKASFVEGAFLDRITLHSCFVVVDGLSYNLWHS